MSDEVVLSNKDRNLPTTFSEQEKASHNEDCCAESNAGPVQGLHNTC